MDPAAKQAKADRWRMHLEDLLAQADDRIEKSERRIADHHQLMHGLAGDERQWQVSIELHRNLQAGLRLLIDHRRMLERESAHLARRDEQLAQLDLLSRDLTA